MCLTEVPNRVLEYGDIETRQNGLRFVTAAILFRAGEAPSWLADPRVIRSLYGRLLAQEVRIVGFRNDGDGWRPILVSDPNFFKKGRASSRASEFGNSEGRIGLQTSPTVKIVFITSYRRLASTVVERDAERVGSAATVRSAMRVRKDAAH